MKRTIVGTYGNYDIEHHPGDGQVVRTTIVTEQLKKALGKEKVHSISYHDWRKRPFSLLRQFISLLFSCDNVVLFLDGRSYSVLVPLSVILKPFAGCKIYYNVIGGWLPSHLKRNVVMTWFIRCLDGLFVQTRELQNSLTALRIPRVTLFPNFKPIRIYTRTESLYDIVKPLRCVFMARVSALKGVPELIEVIKRCNIDMTRFTLDIYGQIDAPFKAEFDAIQQTLPETIRYMGVTPYLMTSEVLHPYFLLLFPTKYDTEGFPGTILDGFCAGVPTLAARWNSFSDIIDEGVNGIGFKFGDYDDMYKKMMLIYEKPFIVNSMRAACVETAKQYSPESIISIMTDILEGKPTK